MRNLLVFVYALLLASNASAHLGIHGSSVSAKSKTATVGSRLIASAVEAFDGNAMVPGDSTHLTYLANLGWDPGLNAWKYANADIYRPNGGGYGNYFRVTRTFNTNDQVTMAVGEIWDNGSNSWLMEVRDFFSYTSTGLLDIALTAHFNGVNWDSMKLINTYDASGLLVQSLEQNWNKTSFSWQNTRRTSYTHSLSNSIAQSVVDLFLGSTWASDTRTLYTYSSGGDLTIAETQKWNGSAWTNLYKLTHTYNGLHEQIATLREVYNVTGYTARYETTRTFNSFNQKITETRKSWNPVSNQFEYAVGDYSERFHYEIFTGVSEAGSTSGLFAVYPVPAKDVIYIRAGNKVMIQAELYDMLGRSVVRPALQDSSECSIDLAGLPSGSYLLSIVANGKRFMQVISVVR